MKTIQLLSIPRFGKNGDRATTNTAYRDYEIHVLEEGQERSKETLFETISGYDHYWTSVKEPRAVETEAFLRVRKIAKLVNGSEQLWQNAYLVDRETARKSAFAKLTRDERLVLGFE